MQAVKVTAHLHEKAKPARVESRKIPGLKPWSEMTEDDILKIKKAKCSKCRYATNGEWKNNTNYNVITCDYISVTGKMRGCRPDMCDKFIPRNGKGRFKKKCKH